MASFVVQDKSTSSFAARERLGAHPGANPAIQAADQEQCMKFNTVDTSVDSRSTSNAVDLCRYAWSSRLLGRSSVHKLYLLW
jgi:hypothetical protein